MVARILKIGISNKTTTLSWTKMRPWEEYSRPRQTFFAKKIYLYLAKIFNGFQPCQKLNLRCLIMWNFWLYFKSTINTLKQRTWIILWCCCCCWFWIDVCSLWTIFESSRSEMFCKKTALKNFAKFTGKHLCNGPFFKVPGLSLQLS